MWLSLFSSLNELILRGIKLSPLPLAIWTSSQALFSEIQLTLHGLDINVKWYRLSWEFEPLHVVTAWQVIVFLHFFRVHYKQASLHSGMKPNFSRGWDSEILYWQITIDDVCVTPSECNYCSLWCQYIKTMEFKQMLPILVYLFSLQKWVSYMYLSYNCLMQHKIMSAKYFRQ